MLVGAGKMGSAMAAGWLEQGLEPAMLLVRDPSPSPEAQALIDKYGLALNSEPENPPLIMVLAVKPQIMGEVLPPLRSLAGPDTLFISIAAGQTLERLAGWRGEKRPMVRVMPNTPAAIGMGMSVACSNQYVGEDQIEHCITLLAAVGEIAWLDDESLMDAVTAVSGSGPAYLFALTECLARAGVDEGLEPALARQLARVTMEGAAALMRSSGEGPEKLRASVTSPGGTTEAALAMLMDEENGLPQLMRQAVRAATRRSRELSKGEG
jgi:pyrroline-5-carboxylate reductase